MSYVSGEDLGECGAHFPGDSSEEWFVSGGSVSLQSLNSLCLSAEDGARHNDQRRLAGQELPDGDSEPERKLHWRGPQ